MLSVIVEAVEGARAGDDREVIPIEYHHAAVVTAPPRTGFPQSRHSGWWPLSVRWMGGRHAPRRPVLARAATSDGRSQPDLSRERRAPPPPPPPCASHAS